MWPNRQLNRGTPLEVEDTEIQDLDLLREETGKVRGEEVRLPAL
jgi:hypothetical protein